MNEFQENLFASNHYAKSQKTGSEAEREFYDSCRAAGTIIRKATRNQNMYDHCDFVMGQHETVDVKGKKKEHAKGLITLELKNVQGKLGWCNTEFKPKWIAFHFGSFFLVVNNKDLYNLASEVCQIDKKVDCFQDCLYRGYTRKNRADLITMVKMADVLEFCRYKFLPVQKHHEPFEVV